MFNDKLSQGDGLVTALDCGFCGQPNPSPYHTCEGKREADRKAERHKWAIQQGCPSPDYEEGQWAESEQR